MTVPEGHQHNGGVDPPLQIDGIAPGPIMKNDEDQAAQPVKGRAGFRRKDAYDVDFSDTRAFAAFRWMDILKATTEKLSPSDREVAAEYYDWELLTDEIQRKIKDPTSTSITKRQMTRIQPFPRSLSSLTQSFEKSILPHEVKFDILWGLIYLNLRLSYDSPDKLKRTSEWLNRVRQIVDLFNRCVEVCDESNEARIAIVDFLDPIVLICLDSIHHLHECPSDAEATEGWPDLSEEINIQVSVLNATVKHLNDITNLTKANLALQVKNLSLKHALTPDSDEPGTFPNLILPFRQNQRFYGRTEELERINRYLSPKGDQSLRTYSIYGRRGVGKTEIAIQFAYTNQAGFDAIFWIQCETLVSIRQSFTNVAVSLDLPGADKDGHHEENLLAVHDWLKKTRKRWLLIFDNAGQDYILKGYWPIGASGAILTTSRKYYNFAKDAQRRGDTVKPFSPKESWDLLLQLLGDDWKKLDREGRIPQSEITAAKLMLDKLGGLALAIQQAAILIKNDEIGGPTIVKTYEMFEKTMQALPKRLEGDRAKIEKGLDTLWDMTFNSCSRNARILLGVLAWLSPDTIPEQLFLPRNQKALDGRLQFCKQNPEDIDEHGLAKPISIATTSPAFDAAIADLLQKELIRQDGRMYSIHRVVQEATNYHDKKDLQESFESASRLVYEAFPKQVMSGSLYKEWNTCQDYIAHGVYLRKRYSDYVWSKQLKPSDTFVGLLINCGVYLMEISDHDTCSRVTQTALLACEDKSSLLYADLLNISGRRCHEQNRLAECRKHWEGTLRIRKEHLPSDHVLVGAIYHNLGNVETATGNLEEATEYYQRATEIYMKHEAAAQLALTDLCVGRLYLLQNKFHEARNMVARSEALFVRELGTDRGFTAHVHYAYGNIEFAQGNWEIAAREYETCLRIALSDTPIHPITAASYYSLACVELELGHPDKAKGYLDKARTISELRSPTRDDGPVARILWKTAVVMESDTFGKHASAMAIRTYAAEAAALRHRADVARQELVASGEGGLIPFIEGDTERDQEEDDYDALIPLYFR